MIREIGGRKVSPVGLGTYGIGGLNSADTTHDAQHVEAMKFAISHGITFIDTAEMYSGGHSEELVGKAIKSFEREDVFITSKVWHTHLRHDDVMRSARASLARLDTGYIDLYLIHWPNRSVPVRETISAMEELVDQGLVRNIGVSNFSATEVEEAISSTSRHRIAANQVPYNMDNREAEKEIIPYCEKNDVRIIAYSPLNRGNLKRQKQVHALAEQTGNSPVSVALSFLMRRSIPIPKSTDKSHILQFVEAMEFELSDEDYRLLSGE